jgi:outer membrane protein assembly factor BamB
MKKLLVALVLLSVVLTGCSSGKKTTFEQKKDAGVDVLAAGLLEGAGMKIDWQNDLPLAQNEIIKHLIIAKEFVYVITDLNTVFCYERFDGKLRFIKQFARPSLPMKRPTEYEGALYTVVGDELWKLDPQSASVSKAQDLVNSAVSPVVFTDENLYVSGLDNRISCYDREGNWLKFQVTADNDSRITSVLVDGENMWFATEQGNVYGASAYEPTRYWAFNTTGQIGSDIVKQDKYLYVSSYDTMLYKLSAVSGTLAWKAPLGSALMNSPVVYDDYIYQQTSRNGLYAVSDETGNVVWQEPAGQGFVARDGEDVYVFTENNLLSIMNNKSGESRIKLNFAPIDICGRNVYDSNVYVLSKDGKLAKISR